MIVRDGAAGAGSGGRVPPSVRRAGPGQGDEPELQGSRWAEVTPGRGDVADSPSVERGQPRVDRNLAVAEDQGPAVGARVGEHR